MHSRRFIIILLFFVGAFLVLRINAAACEQHEQSSKTATHHTTAAAEKTDYGQKKDCCSGSASKHPKGHCTHDNCTNNICHPVSVVSLHAVSIIEINPLAINLNTHTGSDNNLQLASRIFAIWQPPRMS